MSEDKKPTVLKMGEPKAVYRTGLSSGIKICDVRVSVLYNVDIPTDPAEAAVYPKEVMLQILYPTGECNEVGEDMPLISTINVPVTALPKVVSELTALAATFDRLAGHEPAWEQDKLALLRGEQGVPVSDLIDAEWDKL